LWRGNLTEGLEIPLGRPMFRREDNIKNCLKQLEWKVMDFTHLDTDTDRRWAGANTVMKI
jgi:hypothetical protein